MLFDQFDASQLQSEKYQIKGFDVHSDLVAGVLSDQTEERLGTVSDVLVNEAGELQYIVVNLGSGIAGRSVLLPVDKVRLDHDQRRVYAEGVSKEQAEALPAFDPQMLGNAMR
ncbi:MAG: PRC-barrel domain-containing protein [Elainella sp. Prado103]|nr:PRC-barrel domain-containing protein [Elainella sp. Prado103]